MVALSPLVHVVPGPDEHGVVRHSLLVHPGLGDDVELLRTPLLQDLDSEALRGRVVVVQLTDRVCGPSLADDEGAAAGAVWARVTGPAARVTVVLHDLPQRSDGDRRAVRSCFYARVAASADAVVVASRHEQLLLAATLRAVRPAVADAVLRRTRVVPLPVPPSPVDTSAGRRRTPVDRDRADDRPLVVGTLGFVYPGKGLELVIDAASRAADDPRVAGREVRVVNLGRASDGHEGLLTELADRAAAAGVAWTSTGWVPDEELAGTLATVDVPVVAHQHVSASGSLATWWQHGRRPVVVRSRYMTEVAGAADTRARWVDDGGGVDELAAAIVEAGTAPAGTWLPEGATPGPTVTEAGRALREVADRPAVSVVVPYYRDQELLDLVLARLRAQRGVLGGLEVVVADDGSPRPPETGAPGGAVAAISTVRQARGGFRVAAARNLGAANATGRVLLFLDGDTVPEDGYVAALQQVCLDGPTLAVGRRRHAWLRGHPWPPSSELSDPAWLQEGYAATDDLRAADDASFRFVLGAVLALSRAVWEQVGGFDETLTGYGGDDWDLGWRCWLAGARLRHVPEAIAWHDGPDLAGREDGTDPERLAAVKNAETRRLAVRLPHPLVRGRGWRHEQPDVVVLLHTHGWTEGQVEVAAEALLRLGDVGVWCVGPDPAPEDGGGGAPGAHVGCPPRAVLARARARIDVTRPVAVLRLPWGPAAPEITAALGDDASGLVAEHTSGVQVRSVRAIGELALLGDGDRPVPSWLPPGWVEPLPGHLVVERWRQSHP